MKVPEPRPLTASDSAAAAEIAVALERSFGYRGSTTSGDLQDWWSFSNLATDSWAFDEAGGLIAFGWIFRRGEAADGGGYVHPAAIGRGFGTRLVELYEEWAFREHFPVVHTTLYDRDEAGAALLEGRGYHEVRRFYEMQIELADRPAAPRWPDGIRVARFRREDARAFYDALNEAFADEWGFVRMEFDEWVRRRVEGTDTSAYFVAWDGDEVAGTLRGEPDRRDMGWVGAIGVRAAWRGRGLGRALLLHSFADFYDRGFRSVGLGVDAENPTGATRLYERVGMRPMLADVVYEKALR